MILAIAAIGITLKLRAIRHAPLGPSHEHGFHHTADGTDEEGDWVNPS